MGGPTSLGDVYDASYGRLVLQLFALCGDLADAEDAVQEAFVKAIGQGRAFDRVLNPEAWLRTAALNHQRNSWRHANVVRRFVTTVPGRQSAPELGPDHVAVVRALAELEPDQRHVVVLRYLADLGTAEIASELGIPEGTVKSRLSRGRERMAPMLDEREETDHAWIDVLRELTGQFRPPPYHDLVAVSRTRRRRTAMVASLSAAAAVAAVLLGAQSITGCKDTAPPVGPSPSPTPSVTHVSPGPQDHPASLYDAGGSLVLVTVDQTDRIATATLWRKDVGGWVRLGTLDRAAPLHWRRDSDGIHLSPGPGSQDLIATGLVDERVGFSRDGGATWAYGSAPGTNGGCVGCFFNVTHRYVYWSTGPDQLWRLPFGADTAERFSLPAGPDPQARYQFPLALADGRMISAERTDDECSGHYRVSADLGDTWSERRALPTSTCLSDTIDDTAYACNEARSCYGGEGVYQSTDLEHWRLATGLSEGWTGLPTCPHWSADEAPYVEGPLPAGDEYFAVFHLNFRDHHEILPRRGILQEVLAHEVKHVLMVSRDDCQTWKRVLR